MARRLVILLTVVLLTGLVACATQPTQSHGQLSQAVAQALARDVRPLEEDLQRARDQGIDALAPTPFSLAAKWAKQARASAENGDSEPKVYRQVASAREALQRARAAAGQVRDQLPDVIQAREKAIKAGAQGLGRAYQEVENGFLALTRAVERKDYVTLAMQRQPVIQGFRRLELYGVERADLGRANEAYTEALREGASKYAPETLAQAGRAYAKAQTALGRHPHGKQAKRLAKEATARAERLLAITRESRSYAGMKPEAIVLSMERNLQRLESGLNVSPDAGASFANQWDQIAKRADSLGERSRAVATTPNSNPSAGISSGATPAVQTPSAPNMRLENAPPPVPAHRPKAARDAQTP